MRGDVTTGQRFTTRTQSEMHFETQIGGYNAGKLAKNINFVVGTILVVSVILDFVSLGFIDVFNFLNKLFLA